MNKFLASALIFAGVAALGYLAFSFPTTDARDLDGFAQCLADKGAVMYGADWCPHCQNEKRVFGKSFRLISYVECPKETQRCIDEGIRGYPTWKFPDGSRHEGEQGVDKLSAISGCVLPNE